MTSVVIYGRNNCPFCTKAITLAESRGHNVTYLNVQENKDFARELRDKLPDVRTVPQIFIDGKHVGGYTDYLKLTEEEHTSL